MKTKTPLIQTWIGSLIAYVMLITAALLAQDSAVPAQGGNADITGLPAARGIYYHDAARGWVALPFTILMPVPDGRAVVLEILNVGSDHAVSDMPGSYSDVQIGNDARPTFFLRGITSTDLYLVRAVRKAGYRELRMPMSRHFEEWAHFRAEDIADIALQKVLADVVTVTPLTNLKPGEYAIATGFEPGARWIRLAFGFGLSAGRTGE
jgi:hypothetical protein